MDASVQGDEAAHERGHATKSMRLYSEDMSLAASSRVIEIEGRLGKRTKGLKATSVPQHQHQQPNQPNQPNQHVPGSILTRLGPRAPAEPQAMDAEQ